MLSKQSVSWFLIFVISLLFGPFVPVHAALAPTCVLRVDQSLAASGDGTTWETAYTDLKLAITNATSGCEVWVAKGVYSPGTTQTDSFSLKNNVGVYGGFDGTETERAQRNWKENVSILDGGNISYHVVSNTSVNNFAVLDGFTIRNGNANGITSATTRGGGMSNVFGAPILSNLIFTGNFGSIGGGMFNSQCNPTITNVIFSGNTSDYGGGIYNFASIPTLTNVIFTGNKAFGKGGGIRNDQSNPILINVTFSGNLDSLNGGAMDNHSSSPQIYNSIIWGNNGSGLSKDGVGLPRFTNSLVQGCIINSVWQPACGNDGQGGSGGNNLDADPLFYDADGPDNTFGTPDDNLRFLGNSPATDAGSNSFLPADTTDLDGDGDTAEKIPYDLDGRNRISGANVNMGAYEFYVNFYLPLLLR